VAQEKLTLVIIAQPLKARLNVDSTVASYCYLVVAAFDQTKQW
jgi:hypothetical protein